MTFDIQTVWAVTVGTYLLFGLLQILLWQLRRSAPFLLYWGASHMASAVGSGMLALRGGAPDWLTVSLGNGFLVLGYSCMHLGLRCFNNQPTPAWWVWLPPLASAALLETLRLAELPSGLRAGFMALMLMVYCVIYWRGAVTAQKTDPLKFRYVVQLAFLVGFGFGLVRLAALSLDSEPFSLTNPTPVMALAGFLSIGLIMYWSLALLLLANERLEQRLLNSAQNDSLTGLLNRRGLFDQAPRVIERCLRGAKPAAVIVFDLDHFKRINDRNGHDVGDMALQAFAEKVRSMVRSTEVFARLGGEEFCLLLPDVNLEQGKRRADQIREAISDLPLRTENGELRFTTSAGVATVRAGAKPLETAMRQADRALYLAKRQGRNKVCSADEVLQETGFSD